MTAEERDLNKEDKQNLCKLKVPVSLREHDRLKVFRQCNLLDTAASDESYDCYVSLCARFYKVPIVLITLLDVNRQCFKARISVDASETPRDIAFCAYTILEETPRVMVIPDALLDPRFCNNPLVVGPPYVRFYAGASIIVDGLKVATLCLLDVIPRDDFSSSDQQILTDLADTISDMMTIRRRQELEERFNGVVMHQSILTVMQDPLSRVQAAYTDLSQVYLTVKHTCNQRSVDELQRKVSHFQCEVDGFSHFLDDAVRVLARVTLADDSVTAREQKSANQAVVVCDLDMVHQSLTAALKEVNMTCPCRNTIPSLKEKLSTHADLLLVCFISWLHAFAAQQQQQQTGQGIAAVTLSLTTCPDHLDVMIVLLDDLIMEARMLQACQAVSTMLAWVGGKLIVSADDGLVQLLVPFVCHTTHSTNSTPPTVTARTLPTKPQPAEAALMVTADRSNSVTSESITAVPSTSSLAPLTHNDSAHVNNNNNRSDITPSPTRQQVLQASNQRTINRSSVERGAIQNYLQSMWDGVVKPAAKVVPLV
jgi:hypothetical protein